jgi:hypothetical protein
MINLKLAEYDLKTGEFQGFLELGKDFLFADYFIFIPKFGDGEYLDNRENGDQADPLGRIYRRDEKDPRNRCNGIFDGLTYGDGRFTLIEDYEDTRMVHYNNEEITLYNIGSGYVSFSHGKYYKN